MHLATFKSQIAHLFSLHTRSPATPPPAKAPTTINQDLAEQWFIAKHSSCSAQHAKMHSSVGLLGIVGSFSLSPIWCGKSQPGQSSPVGSAAFAGFPPK